VVQDIIVKNAPKEQPYSIAIGRQKTNKNPNYEGHADLVDFALNVTDILDNLDNHELCSYKESVSCKGSSQ